MYGSIKVGMPDAKFRLVYLTTDGESFKANINLTGIHTPTIPSLKKSRH